MDLKDIRVFELETSHLGVRVCCGWRERSSGGGREFLLMDEHRTKKYMTDKDEKGEGMTIRTDAKRFSHDELVEMKKLLNGYKKEIKHTMKETKVQQAV
ncbi:hypothetical protein J6T21_04000 [Candidatus Saccharibacteria bacterium]|nr:hypothetical protein [Candidatus Saccharibacteria bacterium]